MTYLDRDMLRRLCRARALLCEELEGSPSVREVAEVVAISRFLSIALFADTCGNLIQLYQPLEQP